MTLEFESINPAMHFQLQVINFETEAMNACLNHDNTRFRPFRYT